MDENTTTDTDTEAVQVEAVPDEWIVIPARLNGRRTPEPNGEIGTVLERGEKFLGHWFDDDWIAGTDGLYYRAEYLDRIAPPRGRHAED